MRYEPDTIWGRTIDGDKEAALPRAGLSLAQRRLLRQLGQPRTFAALVARYRLDAQKLEQELIRLAERRLVAYQRPGAPRPRTAPQIELPAHAATMLPPAQWQPPVPVYLLALALGLAGALWCLL